MSGLRSALDEVASEDFEAMSEAELEEAFEELQWASRVVQAHLLRCLSSIDRRATYAAEGHGSTVSWLRARFGAGGGSASEQVRVARALRQMPATAEAFRSGDLGPDAVRILAGASEADPEVFGRDEQVLLDAALGHPVGELRAIVSYWRQAVDGDERAERLWRDRRLFVSHLLDGMVRVDGTLDPESGEVVITALRAIQDAEARTRPRDDDRTPAQRRADAMAELARRFLDHPDRPAVGGERPHVTLTVGIDALRGLRGGVSEFGHTGPVDPSAARRWVCDAAISRIVLGPRSEPLDVGRRTHVVPAPIRRAVIARDRHCAFPGCDRPPPWCDAHHVVHWADGGDTALSNLVLLCRSHHRLIHRRAGFEVRMDEGRPIFVRSDVSVVADLVPT
jgi:hypothetical protein